MSRQVVIWSGGMDSTLLLDQTVDNLVGSEDSQVTAISILSHNNINKNLLRAQSIAQQNYLKFASDQGKSQYIDYVTVEILGTYEATQTSQSEVWLCHIFPYLQSQDTVMFGYIKQDCFWHFKDSFVQAFTGLCTLKEATITLEFPLEWKTKVEILDALMSRGIPESCWWTCEDVVENMLPCGKCSKCDELSKARQDLSFHRLKNSLPTLHSSDDRKTDEKFSSLGEDYFNYETGEFKLTIPDI